MYVDVLKRDAFFELFYLFFDNIGVTKLYLCVHFCECWQNESFVFVDILCIFVRLSSKCVQCFVI